MSDSIVVSNAPTPGAPRAIIHREAIAEAAEQRELLGEYIRKNMVEGTDYGTIPGAGKERVLKKPGAEKLVDLYRCRTEFEKISSVEDWEKGFFHYEFKARIVHRESGMVFAEGFGSCNSREAKYRWRNASRACPNCGKDTIIKGKQEYGGGWVCFAKKGGCGAKFKDKDQSIEGQVIGRVENPDICDQVNTLLKMAQKRALVAGAITLARVSDLFTQDMEDEAGAEASGRAEPDQQEPPPPGEPPPSQNERIKGALKKERPAANEHHARIVELFAKAGVDDPQKRGEIIVNITGKKSAAQLTADDVALIQGALVAEAQMGNAPA